MDMTARSINWQDFANELQKSKKDTRDASSTILILSDGESTQEAIDEVSKKKSTPLKRRRSAQPKNTKRSSCPPARLQKSSSLAPKVSSSSKSKSTRSSTNGPSSSVTPEGRFRSATKARSKTPRVKTMTPRSRSKLKAASESTETQNNATTASHSTQVQPPEEIVCNQNEDEIQISQPDPNSSAVPENGVDQSCNLLKHISRDQTVQHSKTVKRPRKSTRKQNGEEKNVALIRPTDNHLNDLQTPLHKTKSISSTGLPLLNTIVYTAQTEPTIPIIPKASCQSTASTSTGISSGIWQFSDNCARCVTYAKSVTPLLKRLKIIANRPGDFVNILEVKRLLADMDNQVFATVMLQLLETFPEKMIVQIAALEQK